MKMRMLQRAIFLIACITSLIEAASAADHHITSDTTWSGTVNMTGNVYIHDGVTLTIQPGSHVIFTKAGYWQLAPLPIPSISLQVTLLLVGMGWHSIPRLIRMILPN
jgi:hypothetical protein